MQAPDELIHLQSLFSSAITPGMNPDQSDLLPRLQGSDRLSTERGLATCRSSSAGKLCRSLQEIYPVCERLVGEGFFLATAMRYIRNHPSLSPNLGDYGSGLAEFLDGLPAVRSLPYLPDVARLEWHWHRAFNGCDDGPLDLAGLARIPQEQWAQLIFLLPRNSALLASHYPVHRIWEEHQIDGAEPDCIDLAEGGVKMFIWRNGLETRIDRPSEVEWVLLEKVAAGETFGQLCDPGIVEPFSPGIDELLPEWVRRGWVRGFIPDLRQG